MVRKSNISLALDIILYLFTYMIIQIVCSGICVLVFGTDNASYIVYMQLTSSLLTIALYVALRWSSLFSSFDCDKPTIFFASIVIFTIAEVFPTVWFIELTEAEIPKNMERIFEQLLSDPIGMLCVGIIVPICEEVVFRGAILGHMLKAFGGNKHGHAICISALLFAIAHGNLAQGPHAFLLGILLGWLVYRTGSLVPGVVLHVVNNSLVLLPSLFGKVDTNDKIIEFFGGDATLMTIVIIISTLIALPSLWWLLKSTPDNTGRFTTDDNTEDVN